MKKILKALGVLIVLLCTTMLSVSAADVTEFSAEGHLQNRGWLAPVSNNGVIGTTGESLNLEAFKITLPVDNSGIEYSAHVASIGWQDPVKNGSVAGTEGENLAIEAVKINLTGEAAENFDIYYRTHIAFLGWMQWTKNGEASGTTGFALPAQALQITIVPKGTEFDVNSNCDYVSSYLNGSNFSNHNVTYSAHVKGIGWQDSKTYGETAGTVGESKRIEAITVNSPDLAKLSPDSGIEYRTHIQNVGWTETSRNGEISGTTGQSLAVQAFQINLTGLAAQTKDIYYRAHVKNIGWLDWAMNGQTAGTEGMDLQLEAFEVKIVSKASPAPGETALPSVELNSAVSHLNLTAEAHMQNVGWTGPYTSGDIIGSETESNGLEAIKLNVNNDDGSVITYNLNIENEGWLESKQNGEAVGTEGQNKQAEAMTLNLAGKASDIFDLYFQVYAEDTGWLGWAKNGEWAGTSGGNKKIQAVRMQLVVEGDDAPGSTENSFIEYKKKYTADNVNQFDLICAIVQHEGGASYESALAVMSCVMNRVDSGRWGGSDPVSVLTAPGQFSSYLGGYYKQFLGRSAIVVQQAVLDCLNGTRSHPYQSFRSYPTSGSVCIGGNYYF